MNNRNKIRNLAGLREEQNRMKRVIRQQEEKIHDDYRQMVDSITPARIIASITGKLITSAPALFTAYSVFRGMFRKKKVGR